MFVSKPDQDALQAHLRAFVVALQQDDQEAATAALRDLYAVIDKLDDALSKHLPAVEAAKKKKARFHPAHVKASKLQQTRARTAREKKED